MEKEQCEYQRSHSFILFCNNDRYYKVTVTNQYGCIKTSSTVLVTVYAKPAAIITAGGPVSFCTGDSVVITANSGTGLTHQWKKDNAAISGATVISYVVRTADIYKCIITNANSCSKTSNVITVSVPCRFGNEANAEELVCNLYPNPVNDRAILTYSVGEKKNVTIEIVNSLGGVIRVFSEGTKENGEYAFKFDTSELPAGYYLVKLIREKKHPIRN